MQNIIFTSVPFDQLQTAISEAVKTEFLKFSSIAPPEQLEFITRKETAQILGVSLVTLHEWTKNGVIQSYRVGTRIRYQRKEVENAIQKVQSLKFGRV